MHDFVTLFIANLEYTGSLSNSVIAYVDAFHEKQAFKITFINITTILSEKSSIENQSSL